MTSLEQALGIDQDSPEDRRALALVEADAELLRSLIKIRKARLSQAEVAALLGISQASVSAFESYDNDPKLSTIRRYSQAVGALVKHMVEADSGQLFAPEGFHFKRVAAPVLAPVPAEKAPVFNVPAPTNAKRRDFARAA